MKKCLELVVLLALVLGSIPSPAQETIVMLGTGDWEPWTSEKLDEHGFFTEIVSAAFQSQQIIPQYTFAPWKRVELMLELDQLFAVFPYVINEVRQQKFDFSEPVAISKGVFFYNKEAFPKGIRYEHLEDLQTYQIVGVLGYWYVEMFEKAGLNVNYVVSDEQSIKLLEIKRHDLAPMDELLGWTLVKKLFPYKLHKFSTVEKPLNVSALHLMVSRNYKNSKNLLKTFNLGLKTIKQNGVYAHLAEKYGMPAK